MKLHPNAVDLTGKKFNSLTAIRPVKRNNQGGLVWLFKCDCGGEIETSGYKVTRGDTKGCGCLWKRHGGYNTPEYQAWSDMKTRCSNPKDPYWYRYGGRGIKVCGRWQNDFDAFFMDVGPRPSASYSLDRVKNDGDYEPSNVRWATKKQQSRNSSKVVNLSFAGVVRPMSEWAELANIKPATLYYRLTNGWSVERALTTPVRHLNKAVM